MDISQQIKRELDKIKIYKKQHENNKENFDELIERYSKILMLSYEANDEIDIKTVLNEFVNFVDESYYRYDFWPHIEKTLEIAQERKALDLELECLCVKGFMYFKQTKKSEAIEVLQMAQSKIKNHNNVRVEIKIYVYFALIFKNAGGYDKALSFLNKVEKLLRNKEFGFTRERSTYYNTLGAVHRQIEKYNKALNHYKKALVFYKNLKQNKNVAKVYNNIGILYQRQKKHKKSLKYLNLALEMKKNVGISIDTTLSTIGDTYTEQMKLKKAEKLYKKSLALSKKKEYTTAIISTEIALGSLYKKQKKYKKSKRMLKKCEAAAAKTSFYSLSEQSYAALEAFYEETKNHKLALRYSKKSREIYQKIQNKKYEEQLIVNDTFNRMREKELEVEKQKEKTSEVKHRIKNHFSVLNGLMRQLKRRKIEQTGIEKIENCIKAMTSLYDMLYEVNDLEPTANLGDFLERLTMQVKDVHQNLDTASLRIVVKNDLDKNITLKAASCLELGLIVAEMMTNSYKYAFKNFDDTEIPCINIELKKNEEKTMIILEVKDNGCGWQEEEVKKRKNSFGKIFIKNYIEQLEGEIEWPKMNEKGTRYLISVPMQDDE